MEENSLAGYRKFLLREGDILYIPRGFPHEACTHDGGSSDLARFSLRHIWYWGGTSFWVGGLCTCSTPLLVSDPKTAASCFSWAIVWNSGSDACDSVACNDWINWGFWFYLAGSFLSWCSFLPLEANYWRNLDQKTTFNNIIDQIDKASRFLEVFSSVEVAIETNKVPFHRMRWLRLLY